MLFQAAALFDSLPVWENIAFGLIARNQCTRGDARDIAAEKLKLVGLTPDRSRCHTIRTFKRHAETRRSGPRYRNRPRDYLL